MKKMMKIMGRMKRTVQHLVMHPAYILAIQRGIDSVRIRGIGACVNGHASAMGHTYRYQREQRLA